MAPAASVVYTTRCYCKERRGEKFKVEEAHGEHQSSLGLRSTVEGEEEIERSKREREGARGVVLVNGMDRVSERGRGGG